MTNSFLIKKAQERAYTATENINSEKPLPKPNSLDTIKNKRLLERELEKTAPLTGYEDLDRIIKGFIPGHVYTVTGVTNDGSTGMK